jgi:hypothetical protein
MLHQLGIAERLLSQLHHINSTINRSCENILPRQSARRLRQQ